MTIGNFVITYEGPSTDSKKNKEYHMFIITRFDEKHKILDNKVFYFAFKPHFKPEDFELIMDLYRLPNHSKIASAHIVFDVEK